MSVDKMQEKIESLKSQLAEERELRKRAQRELNDTKKLLSRAQSLAAKMGQACAALNEAVNEGEAAAPKRGDKTVKAGTKTQNTADKPIKKVRADKPKKVVKIVESDDEGEAPATKKVKTVKKVSSDKGDKKPVKKPIKKVKGELPSKKVDKSEVKKDTSDKKGKGKSRSKNDDLDLDDTYED